MPMDIEDIDLWRYVACLHAMFQELNSHQLDMSSISDRDALLIAKNLHSMVLLRMTKDGAVRGMNNESLVELTNMLDLYKQ